MLVLETAPEAPWAPHSATHGPLRVATFNVGLMSTFIRNWDRNKDYVGAVLEGLVNLFLSDADATVMGRRVARRLLQSPYDLVVLNEIFHADARDSLVAALSDPSLPAGVRYPWILTGFGAEERTPASGNPYPMPWDVTPDLGPFSDLDGLAVGALRSLLDDSGLLVASRLPLRQFTLGGQPTTWGFARYSATAGIDALAPKGAASVVLDIPGGTSVVVAFTHLQADYDEDTVHSAVRAAQLEQLVWLARGVGSATNTRHVLVMGDLNIRGEVPPDSPGEHQSEYDSVFAPSGMLGRLGPDGWRTGACAPAVGGDPEPGRFDLGVSHPGSQQRLDYVVVGRFDGYDPLLRSLAVQHLMLADNLHDGELAPDSPIGLGPSGLRAPRGHVLLSDHIGLNAVIGEVGAHATPALAAAATPPSGTTGVPPETMTVFDGVPEGDLRWLLLEPGAYRISAGGDGLTEPVDVEVYRPTDLAAALADVMPPDPSPVDVRMGARYPAVDHPLLVRLHARNPGVDRLWTRVRRIIGATPDDAVPLRPWTPTAPTPWPTPAQGGRPDKARWFEVVLDPPSPAVEQSVSIHVRGAATPDGEGPPLGAHVDVYLRTTIGTPEAALGAPDATLASGVDQLTVTGTDDHDRRFLIKVVPDDPQADAVIELRSNLCFLLGASFVALDETGIDWSGEDEIRWRLTSDLHPPGTVLGGYEGDVDTGEAYDMPTGGALAFSTAVTVTLSEDAGLAPTESATLTLLPDPGTVDKPARVTATLPDDVRDGTYGVDYLWTRVLRNQ
jgi:hypothetical protein